MYSAIAATTETLRAFLQQQIDAAPDIVTLLGPVVVTPANPQEVLNADLRGLSVWLYRVARDEETLNAPPERLSPTTERHPPLPLRLHYLVTPLVEADAIVGPQVEQLVLGRVLQVLYDRPRFSGAALGGSLAGTTVELRARLEPLTLEELTRIWDALDAPYQLSVSYEVTIVNIDSDRIDSTSPVLTVIPDVGVIVAGAGVP